MLTTDRGNPIYDNIPQRFRHASLDDLDPMIRGEIAHAVKTNLGIIFQGPIGRGKTHAMAAMARAVRDARGLPDRRERWIDWLGQLDDMRIAWKMRADDARWFDPFAWAGRVRDQIFVDDVGAEPDSEIYGVEKFAWLVNERYRQNLVMSFTTNLAPKAIEERYGTRTMSRLYGMCKFVEIDGPDRRVASAAARRGPYDISVARAT